MNPPVPNDTSPEIEALQIEGYRRMSATRKLEIVASLTQAARELALADVRRRYPDDSPRDQQLRAASRWIEPALMLHAYGWNVEEKGY